MLSRLFKVLVLLIVAVQLFTGCQSSAVPSDGSQKTTVNDYSDEAPLPDSEQQKDSNALPSENIDDELQHLKDINNGTAPEIVYSETDDDTPSFICGKFTDKKVESLDDAVNSLNDVSNIMGIADPTGEYVGVSVNSDNSNNYYELMRTYNGIPVYSDRLIVATDKDGNTVALGGSHTTIDVDTEKQRITPEQAYSKALEQGLEETDISSESELFIFIWDDGNAEVCYKFDGVYTVFISAVDGSCVSMWDNVINLTGLGKPVDSDEYIEVNTFLDTTRTGNQYIFYDDVRNIIYIDLENKYNLKHHLNNFDDFVKKTYITDYDNVWDSPEQSKAVTMYKNLSTVYDLYANLDTINFRYPEVMVCAINNSFYSSASWGSTLGFIKNDYKSLKTIAHEYTHSVQKEINEYIYDGENGALMEAYSDLMGVLTDLKVNGTTNWKDARNIKNPSASNNPSYYKGENWLYFPNGIDNFEHRNSTVISHAVYNMYEDGLNDVDELITLLYKTWHYITPGSNFKHYATAMKLSAMEMGLSDEKIKIITSAFHDVGVFTEPYAVMLGTPIEETESGDMPVIADVSVYNSKSKLIINCDVDPENGRYLVHLPSGEYTVEVSAKGYKTLNDGDKYCYEISVDEKGTITVKLDGAELLTPEDQYYEALSVFKRSTSDFRVLDSTALNNSDSFDPTVIETVTFLDSTANAPARAMDFSKAKDGTVLAWVDGTALYISADGGVVADEDVSELFADEYLPEGTFEFREKFIALKEINFNNAFDTSNVTNMSEMFDGCKKLTTLDVSNFDTSNVTDMSSMFYSCTSLSTVDVSNFDTSNVTDMEGMFAWCENITVLDVSKFDTSNVKYMSSMFFGCKNLTSLDLSKFDTSNVKNMKKMFDYCGNLISLDVSSFDTSNVTNMFGMFSYCEKLTTLDVSNFDTSNVTNMSGMFDGCDKLTTLDVSNFDTSNVTNMSGMFDGCEKLTTLDVSNFDTSNVTDMTCMFNGCEKLTTLDVSNFDTSNVTNMFGMFSYCEKLTTLDVSNFDTSNVTDMTIMFSDCKRVTFLDVSGFDTSNVTSMFFMFSSCESLTSLDVSGFDTSNVTSMSYMFYGCRNLASLDVSGFDISNVVDMVEMFEGCYKLKGVDLSRFQ